MLRKWIAAAGVMFTVFSTGCCGGPCGCGPDGVFPNRLASRVGGRIVNPCADGCGEVYYGERINNPPVCDPCGTYGEYTGTSCGECQPLLTRLRQYWGLPYIGACECATPGCNGCDSFSGAAPSDFAYETTGMSASPHCASCAAGRGEVMEYAPGPSYTEPIHTQPQQPTPATRPAPSHEEPHTQPDAAPQARHSHGPRSHGTHANAPHAAAPLSVAHRDEGTTAPSRQPRRIRPASATRSIAR